MKKASLFGQALLAFGEQAFLCDALDLLMVLGPAAVTGTPAH